MGNSLSYKQILESLNNIDKKCIDENTTFYDLRETFKGLVEDLSYEDREDIKDVIDATKNMPNDKAADTIAAVLVAKDSNDEKNESLEEDDDNVDKIIDINTLNPEDLKLLAVYIVNDARKESVIHEEDLVEASYGGAYDIEDDMFFTKDELVEFGYDLVDKFSNWAECKADLADMYMTSPVDLVIEVLEDYDIIHQAKVRIDMRKIKRPKDVYKYEDIILKQWEDSYNEYHKYDECFIKEDIDEIYSYEQMENELKFASDNWTKDPFEGNIYYEEEFDYAIEILSKHYENVKRQRRGNNFWFKATRPSLFEDAEKNSKGKWVNKGKEGTHGEFKTKKEADAQRKAIFANGYSESLDSNNKKGYWDGDIYIPEVSEDGIPYLPKEFWEDWD